MKIKKTIKKVSTKMILRRRRQIKRPIKGTKGIRGTKGQKTKPRHRITVRIRKPGVRLGGRLAFHLWALAPPKVLLAVSLQLRPGFRKAEAFARRAAVWHLPQQGQCLEWYQVMLS